MGKRRLSRVCVFCGSSCGNEPAYVAAAAELGRLLAWRGLGLVFGGGRVGLMGAVADAALAAGGEVIGVIPHGLMRREVAHEGLSDLRVVASMHERKALMCELSDAFVALPGGFGTLDELFEIVTWAQLGIHDKPIALLNVQGFFDPLLAYVDHAAGAGLIQPRYRSLLSVAPGVREVLDLLEAYVPPDVPRWGSEGTRSRIP